MIVKPISFDSLGTRSVATLVETSDISLVIDPGAALGPRRYGLSPHPLEKERLREHKRAIREAARRADALIVTHYHYDHYLHREPSLVQDKLLLIKDPRKEINRSQMWRSSNFLSSIEGLPREIRVADGRQFRFGETELNFSSPVPHGSLGTPLGYVLMCSIRSEGDRVVFTSDVEGPSFKPTAKWITRKSPELLILDGVATLFIGSTEPEKTLDDANTLLSNIIRETEVRDVVLDHHIVRDIEYKQKIGPVVDTAADRGARILTAAELLGLEPDFLEAKRRRLYDLYPAKH